jgi:hypothetical protein
MLDAVEKWHHQAFSQHIRRHSLQRLSQLGVLDRDEASVHRALQTGSRPDRDLKVAKPLALDPEATFGDRMRSGLAGQNLDRVSVPR